MKIAIGSRLPPSIGETRYDPVPEYTMGQRVELFADFMDDSGAAADPTAVVLTLIAPDGTITTPSPANPSVGAYTYAHDVPLASTSAGVWSFRFEGSGAVVAAGERRFEVASSEFD